MSEDPERPASTASIRDAYGFEVSKEHTDLYATYAPVWKQEEVTRIETWHRFLEDNLHLISTEHSSSDFSSGSYEALLENILHASSSPTSPALADELQHLVAGGLPFALRGKAWKVFLRINKVKVDGRYEELVEEALGELKTKKYLQGDDIKGRSTSLLLKMSEEQRVNAERTSTDGMNRFPDDKSPTERAHEQIGIKAWNPNTKSWLSQIEKDLHRTFPGHQLMDKSGRCALRRILAAYSLQNPAVGYCQGMNFIAGSLLFFMDEEDAFWCLGAIVEDVLPGYYSLAMVAPQVDQRVFSHLVAEQLPPLHDHLTALGVDASCVFTQWFLCCFVNILPLEACLRVWDLLFLTRSALTLFHVGMALFNIYSGALLSTDDLLDACELLQAMAPQTFNSAHLMQVASTAFTDITDDTLNRLRLHYRPIVVKEMERGGPSKLKTPSMSLKRRLLNELNAGPDGHALEVHPEEDEDGEEAGSPLPRQAPEGANGAESSAAARRGASRGRQLGGDTEATEDEQDCDWTDTDDEPTVTTVRTDMETASSIASPPTSPAKSDDDSQPSSSRSQHTFHPSSHPSPSRPSPASKSTPSRRPPTHARSASLPEAPEDDAPPSDPPLPLKVSTTVNASSFPEIKMYRLPAPVRTSRASALQTAPHPSISAPGPSALHTAPHPAAPNPLHPTPHPAADPAPSPPPHAALGTIPPAGPINFRPLPFATGSRTSNPALQTAPLPSTSSNASPKFSALREFSATAQKNLLKAASSNPAALSAAAHPPLPKLSHPLTSVGSTGSEDTAGRAPTPGGSTPLGRGSPAPSIPHRGSRADDGLTMGPTAGGSRGASPTKDGERRRGVGFSERDEVVAVSSSSRGGEEEEEEDEDEGPGAHPADKRAKAQMSQQLGIQEILDEYEGAASLYLARMQAALGPSRQGSLETASTSGAPAVQVAVDQKAFSAAIAEDPTLLEQLVAGVVGLQGELEAANRRRADAEDMMGKSAQAVAKLQGKMHSVLGMLAEKDRMLSSLADKLNNTFSELASQDIRLAEQDAQLKELRSRMESAGLPTHTAGSKLPMFSPRSPPSASGGSVTDNGRWSRMLKFNVFKNEDRQQSVGQSSLEEDTSVHGLVTH